MLDSFSNLVFDICAIIILIVVLVAVFFRRLLNGRDNALFISMCIVVLVTTICDVWDESYVRIFKTTAYNIRMRTFVNYLYFFLHNLTAPLFILYAASVMQIWHKIIRKSWKTVAFFVPVTVAEIVLLGNLFTEKVFYFDFIYLYHRGPLINVFYFVAFLYFVFSTYMLLKFKNIQGRRSTIIMLMFLPIMAGSVVLQLLVPYLRIEMFATAIMAIVIGLGVQRPDETIDFVVDLQNNNAFLESVQKAGAAGREISVLVIKFLNEVSLRNSIGMTNYQELTKMFGSKLEQLSKILKNPGNIYYLNHGIYAVVCDDSSNDDLIELGRMMVSYLQEPVKTGQFQVMVDAKGCVVRYPKDIDDMESFTNFVYSFYGQVEESKKFTVVSDISSSRDFKIWNDMDLIINRGINNNSFQMYYQPIYDIKSGKFLSAEALIRLNDDKYGFVSPALFIPVAERNGTIHQIGDFVLEEVCKFIASKEYKDAGLEYIEVNLSVSQCIEINLAEKINSIMEKYHVLPEQINMEITETAVDADPKVTDRNISLLSQMGITFSLDDYGTGFSNIKRVVSLPLDIVKLDKCLVDDMDSPIMWTVITSTVKMLKEMNIKILVEGVEELRQLAAFKKIQCDYIQGYYFSKPLPAKEFIDFVNKNNKGAVNNE